MSVASRRLWWAALVICAATLSGIVIGELTVDLPRVRTRLTMVIGPIGAAIWVVAGLISWRVRPDSKVGPLMVLIGWIHPAEPLLAGLFGAYVQWVLWIVMPIATLINQMALSFPGGRLTRVARIVVGVAWASWFIYAVAVALDARSDRCPACPPNPFPFANQDASDAISGFREPLAIALWIVTAVILAHRWHVASAPGRRALNPMLWGTLQYAVLTVLLVPLGFGLSDGRPDKPAFWSFALIPVGVLIGMLRTRQHHSAVADLMVKLRAQPGPEELRALLARALGDPSLKLAYWLPDRRVYVDAAGSAVELPDDDRRISVLRDDSDEPLAALVYDPALLEDPKLLEAVSSAAQFALENSRLQAELRARLHDVRESRARLVTATDAERRRIERNLHDGAQQTLLGLRLAVRLARNRTGDPQVLDTLLADIDEELQGAVEELRTLARGVHPPILSEEGLEPALAALARHAAIPTEVVSYCPERLPAPVETAAYYVAAEALANVHKHAHASRARIDVARTDGHAVIEVSDDGCGGADPQGSGLRGLRDRVEALDGTLAVLSTHHGHARPRGDPMRVILADDAVIIRQGLARLLADHGLTVVAQVETGEDLLEATAAHDPDVAIVDIRMPPTFTNEGLRAAHELRARHPRLGVLVLSQYVDVTYALKLIHEGGERLGYLLKDRMVDIPAFAGTLRRLMAGECVIEPTLVEALVRSTPLSELTAREREVLALMAEGRTDRGIRETLYLSQKTVESHTRSIFRKLAIPSTPTDNRRVHAVLAFLRQTELTSRAAL